MTDLITRLQRLSGENPVARLVLTPDDWPEIEQLLHDALCTEVWKTKHHLTQKESA